MLLHSPRSIFSIFRSLLTDRNKRQTLIRPKKKGPLPMDDIQFFVVGPETGSSSNDCICLLNHSKDINEIVFRLPRRKDRAITARSGKVV